MMRATMTLLSIALLLFQAAGTPLRVPDLQPLFRESTPNSPAENVILRAGNALYTERKYDEAYFIEMQQKNFVEPFVYYVSQRTSIPGVREWLTANDAQVK